MPSSADNHKDSSLSNLDPTGFTGLQLPAFILRCLASGMSVDQIALKFPEDGELVALWISFLRGNRWTTKDSFGNWSITPKGQQWISKYAHIGEEKQ